MDDKQTMDARQMFTEIADELRIRPAHDANWAQLNSTTLPAWISMPSEMYARDGGHSDVERVACLECIIAILIEKNECMRQQLRMHMD